MKTIFLAIILLTSCGLVAQPKDPPPFHTTWVYRSNQAPFFVSRGRMSEATLADAGHIGFGACYVYFTDKQEPILVDGTPATMTRILQTELPDGISEEFLKEKLSHALSMMMSNGNASVIIKETMEWFDKLKLEGQSKSDTQKALKVMLPPVIKSEKENWRLDFDYVTRDGLLYRVSCVGTKKPFVITTLATKLLPKKIPAGVFCGEGQDYSEEEKEE